MSLKDKIGTAMKEAMKAKQKERLTAIRAIKSQIILAETESGVMSETGLNEEQEIQLLTKMAKQRRDSITTYEEQGRDDLKAIEEGELAVISEFLPAQLSEAEVEATIKEIIAQTGASTMKDMGKVMGLASSKMAGVADGKVISTMVKALLA